FHGRPPKLSDAWSTCSSTRANLPSGPTRPTTRTTTEPWPERSTRPRAAGRPRRPAGPNPADESPRLSHHLPASGPRGEDSASARRSDAPPRDVESVPRPRVAYARPGAKAPAATAAYRPKERTSKPDRPPANERSTSRPATRY